MKKLGMILAAASALALAACSGGDKDDGAATSTEEVSVEKSPAEGGLAGETPESAAEAAAKDEAMGINQPPASGKEGEEIQARCVITAKQGNGFYDDSCMFESTGGKSFIINPGDDPDFFDGIKEIVVEADTDDAAGLSVRDAEGNLNYTGPSKRNGACWSNDSFDVCAYALEM